MDKQKMVVAMTGLALLIAIGFIVVNDIDRRRELDARWDAVIEDMQSLGREATAARDFIDTHPIMYADGHYLLYCPEKEDWVVIDELCLCEAVP